MTRVRICGLLLALLLPLVGACSESSDSPESFSEEDRLLEGLMEDYVTARFHFYPAESTLSGLPGNDDRLGSFSHADVVRRISWLYDFHNRLSGLRLTGLSEPAFLDSLWLTSLTKAELFDLESRRTWATSPSWYANAVRGGIVSLLLAPDLASRTDALGGRLDAIPTLLDQAQENLGPLSDAERRDGLRSFQLCRDLLVDLPSRLEDELPSYRVADLAERSRVATRSVQAILARLAEPAPGLAAARAATPVALGEDGLAQWLRYREMVDWPPQRILEEAEKRFANATNELTELALERFSDLKLEDLLSATPPLQGNDAATAEAVRGYEARVRGVLEARQTEGRPEEPIPVRTVPSSFLAPDLLRLWRPAALASVKDVSLLLNANDDTALPRELELLTLQEVGGRYRQYVRQSESRSLLRRVVASTTASEGWLDRVVARLVAGEYANDDPELEIRRLQRVRLASLRLSAVVRFHALGLSSSAVEREFRERGLVGRDRAADEALSVAVDPGVGSAALGSILLDDLARDYRKAHPLATDEELEATLLAEGLVPIRLIRFRLLGNGEHQP